MKYSPPGEEVVPPGGVKSPQKAGHLVKMIYGYNVKRNPSEIITAHVSCNLFNQATTT